MGWQMTVRIAGTLHDRASSFASDGEAYDRSSLYRDMSLSFVVPTRDGNVPFDVAANWWTLGTPMNQNVAGLIAVHGMEVAAAYNQLFSYCIDTDAARDKFGGHAESVISTKFVVTMEADNLPEPDAILKLLAAIYTCPNDGCGGEVAENVDYDWRCSTCSALGYAAVSGLYSVKLDPPVPMAFGDPSKPNDFTPRRVSAAMRDKRVIEVNGIAMGCAVWRKETFREVSRPWFATEDGTTQDIYFCKKAKKEVGARFGVHCGVKVGHLDVKTGQVF
jgi:hypothetical protein